MTAPLKAAVLTVSDSVVRGERQDVSGPSVAALLKENGYVIAATQSVADEREAISAALIALANLAQLVVTAGGTGLSPRDITPEATLAVCDRQVPGMVEKMRALGAKQTELAYLSRAVCGTRGQTLILNLPGSPQGATDSLRAVLGLLPHALELLRGHTEHRAPRS